MQLSVFDPQRLACPQHRLNDPIQHGLPGHQLPNTRHKPGFAHLPHLQPEPAQDAANAELNIQQLGCSSLRATSRALTSYVAGDLACTGRNQRMRNSCAMPRASLRSVLTTIADSVA